VVSGSLTTASASPRAVAERDRSDAPVACTSVHIMQIALRPWLGPSGAAIVVLAYGLGAGRPSDALLLVVETHAAREQAGAAEIKAAVSRSPGR
jgi:hypothetical protein